ncbi:putative LRR receptor-like serine/threonine-protein kinase [Drosera capensis]
MGSHSLLLHFLLLLLFSPFAVSQPTEFISIDCGGLSNYTDTRTGLPWISDMSITNLGEAVDVATDQNVTLQQQYRRRRDFPADGKKYCYSLPTEERRRYIVRATFLYGRAENSGTYPKFQLYLDATKWGNVAVVDGSKVYVEEMVVRAPSDLVAVCLCCATAGSPFISTLELRPLNLSMYATDFEDSFYLKVAARVNFGAPTYDSIRYPDDPYDRIWDSDLSKGQNNLVAMSAGTERIETLKNIDVNTREYPPVKVMQTAVVGGSGRLSYKLDLEDFPANARAYAYFAEIEDLEANETRTFKIEKPYVPDYSNAVVNIVENANGSYKLYEPSFMNVTLDSVLLFSFVKTTDSTQGPLLNAIEIGRYVPVAAKTDTQDVRGLKALQSMSSGGIWAQDGGDPCNPVPWEWVACSNDSSPRITKICLSGKNLLGGIPSELQNMEGLTELWLDKNLLTGDIPDMSNLIDLKILHLENNRLTGPLPSYLGSLPSLQELYIQNNCFSGEIPPALLSRKLVFRYNGNPKLTRGTHGKNFKIIIASSAIAIFMLMFLGGLLLLRSIQRKRSSWKIDHKGDSFHTSMAQSPGQSLVRGEDFVDKGTACRIKLAELEAATMKFSKSIGRGSSGPVYYGKMEGGKEVAVKIMAGTASQVTKQFETQVVLLSRIHHRNLVQLIGYCEEANQRLLVYEYMQNQSLKEHLDDPSRKKQLNWLTRLAIAEDAAKGLEYLHTGCSPSIVHRDVKTSNILLDIDMRAKVSNFGFSRQADEELTQTSSIARGSVGYQDPECYMNQQPSRKIDVYSFGIILFELISGRKPISEDYGNNWNIVNWARSLIGRGDITSMVDPHLIGSTKLESVWRVAEVAIQCVHGKATSRPKMQGVILAIQEAIKIEKGTDHDMENISSGSLRVQSSRKTLLTSFLEVDSPYVSDIGTTTSS